MKKISILFITFAFFAISCNQPTRNQAETNNHFAKTVIQPQSNRHQLIPIEERFDSIAPVSEGLMAVRLNGLYGFIDTLGQIVVCLIYEDVRRFSENRAAVKYGGKWGFIDDIGIEITPFKYEDVRRFSENRAAVKYGGKWGFIDETGKEVIPFRFNLPTAFWRRNANENAYAFVGLDGYVVFIDTMGRVLWRLYDPPGSLCGEWIPTRECMLRLSHYWDF